MGKTITPRRFAPQRSTLETATYLRMREGLLKAPTLRGCGESMGKKTSPLCSKAALADSVEDPLEASPLCSKAAVTVTLEAPAELPSERKNPILWQ